MNRPLKEIAYGSIPNTFDTFLEKTLALDVPKEHAAIPKRRVIVIAVAVVLLIGCTALAVAHQMGILDVINIWQPGMVNREEAAGLITTDITQSIVDLAHATVSVREAYYDGTMLRVLIEAVPKIEGEVPIPYPWTKQRDMRGEAAAFGDTFFGMDMHVYVDGIENPFTGSGSIREGASLLFPYTTKLPDGQTHPGTLNITARATVYGDGSDEIIEMADLVFTVQQSAKPVTQTFPINLSLEMVDILDVTINRTPLEMIVSFRYQQNLFAFRGIEIVPENGIVSRVRYYSTFGSRDPETGIETYEYQLPPGESMPGAITLLVLPSNDIVIIDTATGAYQVRVAEVEHREMEMAVTIVDPPEASGK